MKLWFKTTTLLVIITVVFGSCLKDDVVEYFIDEPLRPYFDRFAEEAALRGFVIDFEALKVSGDIRVISAHQVIGQCIHTDKEPNTVIVDKLYWDAAADLEREFLVFHELGHCVLNRQHRDDADTHGDCVSMMTSGTGLCMINYTMDNREVMLDELFIF